MPLSTLAPAGGFFVGRQARHFFKTASVDQSLSRAFRILLFEQRRCHRIQVRGVVRLPFQNAYAIERYAPVVLEIDGGLDEGFLEVGFLGRIWILREMCLYRA